VSTANADQREFWNSPRAADWIEDEDRYDAQLAPYIVPILDAAALERADHVLDVGCGCGATTLAASHRSPDGRAVGLDISAPMIERARTRALAQGLANARFVVGDAQTDGLDGPYDAMISRFGVMFFDDPGAAFTNIARALRPGGRVAFACWQDLFSNEWLAVPAIAALEHVPMPDLGAPGAPGPFAFADRERIERILDDAGLVDVGIEPRTDTLTLGGYGAVDEVVDFISRTGAAHELLDPVPADTRARALEAIREALRTYETPEGVRVGAAAWLVTARRP
jgi:SAM-dependent methyltransferase